MANHLKVLGNVLNAQTLLQNQNQQYSDKIVLTDTVPGGASHQGRASVSNLGHFLCQYITGHFWTLATATAEKVDTGINYLRGKLIDGAGQRNIFDDYVPFDLFLTPGRVKTSVDGAGNAVVNFNLATASNALAAAGNNLFYPFELEYLFSANSDIIMDVKNDSDLSLQYTIVFHGIRILYQK